MQKELSKRESEQPMILCFNDRNKLKEKTLQVDKVIPYLKASSLSKFPKIYGFSCHCNIFMAIFSCAVEIKELLRNSKYYSVVKPTFCFCVLHGALFLLL